jgi:hypothetical protein
MKQLKDDTITTMMIRTATIFTYLWVKPQDGYAVVEIIMKVVEESSVDLIDDPRKLHEDLGLELAPGFLSVSVCVA